MSVRGRLERLEERRRHNKQRAANHRTRSESATVWGRKCERGTIKACEGRTEGKHARKGRGE